MSEIEWPDRLADGVITDISAMIGRTPVEISRTDDEIAFVFADGSACLFYHEQDCCESVEIEDVTGDLNDLIGHPILVAEVRTGTESPKTNDANADYAWQDESSTWTFYTFRSIGGTVDVRWYGASNGYYSEKVDFIFAEGLATPASGAPQ